MFKKDKELISAKQEIENNTQKAELEKYKKLYEAAKATTTPFSDSKLETVTEDTHGIKPTPTELKPETPKRPQNKDLENFKQDNTSKNTLLYTIYNCSE